MQRHFLTQEESSCLFLTLLTSGLFLSSSLSFDSYSSFGEKILVSMRESTDRQTTTSIKWFGSDEETTLLEGSAAASSSQFETKKRERGTGINGKAHLRRKGE